MPKLGNDHGNVSKMNFWCVFFIEIAVKNQKLGLELSQK